MKVDYSKFEDEMNDILSSGPSMGFYDVHQQKVRELFEKVDGGKLVAYLNRYYETIGSGELREGELEGIAELIDGTVHFTIEFRQ